MNDDDGPDWWQAQELIEREQAEMEQDIDEDCYEDEGDDDAIGTD